MKGARILLVEDDTTVGIAIKEWLVRMGALVTYATGPAEADKALALDRFEIMLSDIQMPGNAQLSWIERIARQTEAPMIVLLTGNPQLDTAIRAANLPICGYLVKPPDFQALASLITRLQQKRRHHDMLRANLAEIEVHLMLPELSESEASEFLARKLEMLKEMLALEPSPDRLPPEGPSSEDLRNAIAETIRVIEATKHSFRSRELGLLRQRLQHVLQTAERN